MMSLFLFVACGNKDFDGLNFEDKSVMYDGQTHSLEVTGVPDFAKVSYTANSFAEIGVYEVTATVTAEGYNDWVKTAKLIIEEPVEETKFVFIFDEKNNDYQIVDYYGEEENLIIPAIYKNRPVSSIGDSAFKDNTFIKTVTICDGIKIIGFDAFAFCCNLTRINIPNSIEKIGSGSFYYCQQLERVDINDISAWSQIEFVDMYSNPLYSDPYLIPFDKERTLYLNGEVVENIEIEKGISKINSYAFAFCNSVKSVVLPEGISSIGDFAFYNCKNLTEIVVPESLAWIGGRAFSYTTIKNVFISDIEAWCNLKICDCDGEMNPFSSASLYLNGILLSGELRIPDGTKEIRYEAFVGCEGLTSVSIPDSVTYIGSGAFMWCESLSGVVLSNNITSINDSTFYGCINLKDIMLPNNISYIGDSAFVACKSLNNIVISKNIKTIGQNAFNACDNLKSIYYEGSIADWENINVAMGNSCLTDATIYYYSESEPAYDGQYWRYVDGVPTAWVK